MSTIVDEYRGPMWINLDRIDIRPAAQMRAKVDTEAIDTYAESFDDLPPVKVFCDEDGTHWLVDGFHRICAAEEIERKEVNCLVRAGTYVEAFAEAARANDAHGVRVTNEDKRVRVRVALNNPDMKTLSARRIADLCGVAHSFILKLQEEQIELDSESSSTDDEAPPKLIGKDGKARPARRKRRAVDDADQSTNGEAHEGKDEPEEEEEEAEAPDPSEAFADTWLKQWEGWNLFLVSLPRRGGIVNLVGKWSRTGILRAVYHLRQLETTCGRCAAELEEHYP